MAARLYFVLVYVDGSHVVGRTPAEWSASPEDGLAVVTQVTDRKYGHPPKHACSRHAGLDYYWMLPDGTIGGGSAKQIPLSCIVKRGQWLDGPAWDALYNAACVDPPYEV